MTEKDILRAIGGIDSALILAAEKAPKKISWKKWIATAAWVITTLFYAVQIPETPDRKITNFPL